MAASQGNDSGLAAYPPVFARRLKVEPLVQLVERRATDFRQSLIDLVEVHRGCPASDTPMDTPYRFGCSRISAPTSVAYPAFASRRRTQKIAGGSRSICTTGTAPMPVLKLRKPGICICELKEAAEMRVCEMH